MDDLTALFKLIEQLSPAGQASVAEYAAFLQWQEQGQRAPAQTWSFSFLEAFNSATVSASDNAAGMDVKMGPADVGGVSRPALWAHPPLTGQAVIEYFVPVPQSVRQVKLHLAVGIRDGAQIAPDNLVAFGVRVNGLRVWSRQTNAHKWEDAVAPLDLPPGDIARIELTTEALGSHSWTWAVWGSPELRGQ